MCVWRIEREGSDNSRVATRWANLMLLLSGGPVHSRSRFHSILKTEALIRITGPEPRERKSKMTSDAGAM
jgi:hypothetical protein